jgi:hypothetical protein
MSLIRMRSARNRKREGSNLSIWGEIATVLNNATADDRQNFESSA